MIKIINKIRYSFQDDAKSIDRVINSSERNFNDRTNVENNKFCVKKLSIQQKLATIFEARVEKSDEI